MGLRRPPVCRLDFLGKIFRLRSESTRHAWLSTSPVAAGDRVVVGVALGGEVAKVVILVILDPDGPDEPVGERPGALPPDGKNGKAQGPSPTTNLTTDMVRKAAMAMRASRGRGFDTLRNTLRTQPPGFDSAQPPDRSLSSRRRIETPPTETPEPPDQIETIFRGPKGATGATREIKLTNEFKENKGHGWLEKM